MSEKYGYICVSEYSQNVKIQIQKMKERGIDSGHLYIDLQENYKTEHKELQKLKDRIFDGDLLYIVTLDSLGNNYRKVAAEWEELTKACRADVSVIDIPLLDTRAENGGRKVADLIGQLMNSLADTERVKFKNTQARGIADAKAQGVKFGRPRTEAPADFPKLLKKYEEGEFDIEQILEKTGMSRSTFYRRRREYL